jgi:uncharacterized membrane protein HdeD (DUF308 family)
MGLMSKIAGYFFGIIIVLLGVLWITSTIPLSVILVGLIGLLMIIGGFVIIYLGRKAGRKKKPELLQ